MFLKRYAGVLVTSAGGGVPPGLNIWSCFPCLAHLIQRHPIFTPFPSPPLPHPHPHHQHHHHCLVHLIQRHPIFTSFPSSPPLPHPHNPRTIRAGGQRLMFTSILSPASSKAPTQSARLTAFNTFFNAAFILSLSFVQQFEQWIIVTCKTFGVPW